MKDYGPRVTVRLSPEELQKAHALMERRGVSKISDFIRQALASELARQAQQDQIAAFSLERMKAAIEKGTVPSAGLGEVLLYAPPRSVDSAVAEDRESVNAAAVALAVLKDTAARADLPPADKASPARRK